MFCESCVSVGHTKIHPCHNLSPFTQYCRLIGVSESNGSLPTGSPGWLLSNAFWFKAKYANITPQDYFYFSALNPSTCTIIPNSFVNVHEILLPNSTLLILDPVTSLDIFQLTNILSYIGSCLLFLKFVMSQ